MAKDDEDTKVAFSGHSGGLYVHPKARLGLDGAWSDGYESTTTLSDYSGLEAEPAVGATATSVPATASASMGINPQLDVHARHVEGNVPPSTSTTSPDSTPTRFRRTASPRPYPGATPPAPTRSQSRRGDESTRFSASLPRSQPLPPRAPSRSRSRCLWPRIRLPRSPGTFTAASMTTTRSKSRVQRPSTRRPRRPRPPSTLAASRGRP